MYALIQIGFILETNMGKYRYLIAYIACGILASVASLAVHNNTVSVGASGAIFGLDGLLLALLITKVLNVSPEWRQRLISSTVVFIGYNLLFGFARAGIDNAAHIGGLISGFLIGLAYAPSLKRGRQSMAVSGIIGVVVVIVLLALPRIIPNKYREFREALQRYGVNEKKGLWMFQGKMPAFILSQDTAAYASRLQTEGIDLWKENVSILSSLTDMPDALQERVDLLKKYSEIRLRECEILKRTINDFTTRDKEISELEKEIALIVKEIYKDKE
jgi:rhomboid protease GluP